jgi:hypothetical protein
VSAPSPAKPCPAAPEGYRELVSGGNRLVVRSWAAEALAGLVSAGTLLAWAATQPHDSMQGRGACYGVTIPAGSGGDPETAVVVRHNQHGGLLRLVTGDRFLAPTRAPLELANALRLAAAGVPTPELIAYALYPAGPGFYRCDVMTRRLPQGADLPEAWEAAASAPRAALLRAVAALLRTLAGCGARHPDLNLKNIYLTAGEIPVAYLLDVDRVLFCPGQDVATPNFERLARSARKWRERRQLDFSEEALAQLASLAMENT